MADTTSSSTTSPVPPLTIGAPLPTDLQNPLPSSAQQTQTQNPAITTTDALDLRSLSATLPLVNTTTALPSMALLNPPAPYPSSHPLLGIHITNYIKFQVTSASENFSK